MEGRQRPNGRINVSFPCPFCSIPGKEVRTKIPGLDSNARNLQKYEGLSPPLLSFHFIVVFFFLLQQLSFCFSCFSSAKGTFCEITHQVPSNMVMLNSSISKILGAQFEQNSGSQI